MAANLLAICRVEAEFVVKRVKTTAHVQELLEGIFSEQEQQFYIGIDEEVEFDGGWKPEKNELLYTSASAEAQDVLAKANVNVVSLDEIQSEILADQGIRALGVLRGTADNPRLLLQNFSARQLLERQWAFIYDGNTFNYLSAPAFTLGTSLAAVIEDGRLKFKSFNNVKLIFVLKHLYQEASNVQLAAFCGHASLAVGNQQVFIEQAGQPTRKLVHAIIARGTLDQFEATAIAVAADEEGMPGLINDDGCIFLPSEKKDLKRLLHFLDDGLYTAKLSGTRYISNSKKPA